MRIDDVTTEAIKLGKRPDGRAKKFVDDVYAALPKNPLNADQIAFLYGPEQLALVELKPDLRDPDMAEIAWISAYPQREGIGRKTILKLQELAQAAGVKLTLTPWGQGKIPPRTLSAIYKKLGFTHGLPALIWKPQSEQLDEILRNPKPLPPNLYLPPVKLKNMPLDGEVWASKHLRERIWQYEMDANEVGKMIVVLLRDHKQELENMDVDSVATIREPEPSEFAIGVLKQERPDGSIKYVLKTTNRTLFKKARSPEFRKMRDDLQEGLTHKDPVEKWVAVFKASTHPKFAGKTPEQREKMARMAQYRAVQNKKTFENMDHSQDAQAVPELKAALLARKRLIKSKAGDKDTVYDIINGLMTSIAKAHGISGQKMHDLWVDQYGEIPDTWILHESVLPGSHTPTEAVLAKQYTVGVAEIKRQLKKGIKVELEHTTDRAVAREIALDHLGENLYYYDQLKQAGLEEAAGMTTAALRDRLNKLMSEDQAYADATQRAPWQEGVWRFIDANKAQIFSDLGDKGNGDYPAAPFAAWLLVQHMDAHPERQAAFYKLLKSAIPNHPKLQFLRDRAAVNQWMLQHYQEPEYHVDGKPLANPTSDVRDPRLFKDAGIKAQSRQEALDNAEAAGNKLLLAAVKATGAKTQPSYTQKTTESLDEAWLDMNEYGGWITPNRKVEYVEDQGHEAHLRREHGMRIAEAFLAGFVRFQTNARTGTFSVEGMLDALRKTYRIWGQTALNARNVYVDIFQWRDDMTAQGLTPHMMFRPGEGDKPQIIHSFGTKVAEPIAEAKKRKAKTIIDGMIKTLIKQGRTRDEAIADLKKQVDSRFYEQIDAAAEMITEDDHSEKMDQLVDQIYEAFHNGVAFDALEAMEDARATVNDDPRLKALFDDHRADLADLLTDELHANLFDYGLMNQIADMIESVGIRMPDRQISNILDRKSHFINSLVSKNLVHAGISEVVMALEALENWGLHYYLEDFVDLEDGKDDVIRDLLKLYKAGLAREVAKIVKRLREEDVDWPELAAIEKSLGAGKITETRDAALKWLKSYLPTWPDYVLRDWMYNHFRGEWDASGDDPKTVIQRTLDGEGMTPQTRWKFVPDFHFTFDSLDPDTVRRIKERQGGTVNPYGIPKDAERHATQATLAAQQGGVRDEPVILKKVGNKYELIEGWHRTIQHFKQFPNGYKGPAWIAIDAKPVSENFADGKGPGRKGDSQRHGIPKGATMAQLEKAAKASGRKGQLARWQINMRRGRAKAQESLLDEGFKPSGLQFPDGKIFLSGHFFDQTVKPDRQMQLNDITDMLRKAVNKYGHEIANLGPVDFGIRQDKTNMIMGPGLGIKKILQPDGSYKYLVTTAHPNMRLGKFQHKFRISEDSMTADQWQALRKEDPRSYLGIKDYHNRKWWESHFKAAMAQARAKGQSHFEFPPNTKMYYMVTKNPLEEGDGPPHGTPENELAMMKAGTKPAALIADHTWNELYEPIMDQYPWVVKKWRLPTDNFTFYTIGQPGEEARIKRIGQLIYQANTSSSGFSTDYHRELGRLLGYSEADVDNFLKDLEA